MPPKSKLLLQQQIEAITEIQKQIEVALKNGDLELASDLHSDLQELLDGTSSA